MRKKGLLILLVLALLTACNMGPSEEEENPEDTPSKSVLEAQKDDYAILLPFENSPLRQDYANNFREVDMMELGGRLQEKTKEYFNPKKYYISEGSVINRDRYYQLLAYQSDRNPNGLNLKPFEIKDQGETIKDPKFVSDIFEVNFHQSEDREQIDGIALALVLKRVQVLDHEIGSTHKLSDDTLYEVGRTLGLRLYSYLTSLEGLADIPIYIGLYVQESDVDQLPGKYLPGHFIGHAFFKTRSDQFTRDEETWLYINSNEAREIVPNAANNFARLERNLAEFIADEKVGMVGKVFLEEKNLRRIQIEVITGSKTYLEMYGLAQFLATEMASFDEYNVPVQVDLRIHQRTRFVIHKDPGKKAEIIDLK